MAPEQVLPLAAEDAARLDRVAREFRYGRSAAELFHLFDAAAGLAPRGRLRTSLQLARRLGTDEQSARQAVLLVEDDCVLATST